MSMISPLKIGSFRILIGAQFLSDMGNWLDFTALASLVAYTWNKGPLAIAMLTFTLGLPWVVVGPFMSVWVDRLPRGPWLASCSLLRVIFALALFWAPNFYTLLIFVFFKEIFGALFDPARQSFIGTVIPRNLLAEATSLSQLSANIMKVVAPSLGGFLIVSEGPRVPFLVEAAGFFISGLLLAWLPTTQNVESKSAQDNTKMLFWVQFKEGWKHSFQNKILAIAIIMMATGLFIVFLYDGLMVLFTKIMKFNQSDYGLLIAAVGFGSVIGSLVVGSFLKWKERPLLLMSTTRILAGLLIVGVGLGALQVIKGVPPLWIGVFFLIGAIGAGSASIPFGYILQTQTDPTMIGRVTAIGNAIQNFSMLVAPAIGGILAAKLGVGIVFVVSGVATSLLGLAFVPFSIRKMIFSNTEKHEIETGF